MDSNNLTNITCKKCVLSSVFTERKINQLQVFLSLTVTIEGNRISPCVFWSIDGKNKNLISSSKRPDRTVNGVNGIFR
jgi:hypothetical protein